MFDLGVVFYFAMKEVMSIQTQVRIHITQDTCGRGFLEVRPELFLDS